MSKFEDRLCEVCNNSYNPTGPAARFCPTCASIKKQESRERDKAKRRNGLGKGYWVKLGGKHHPGYKNGIGMYKKIREEKLKEQNYKCSRCGTDLSSVSPHHKCGHHIDHDRTNNHPDNIEVVCKRCHQIEHECWKAFEGATTIPKGSTQKSVEAPATER